jgi:glyoxylase-like metal-dependent hydrolase (beta-lactamase superfamily II)
MNFVRKSFPVGPLQCNCTVLGDTDTGLGYVFDPGGNPEKIMAAVTELGLKIVGLVHTHAHLDHFLAAGAIRAQTGAPIWLHQGDKFLWDALEQQCHSFGVPYTPQPDPDHWLEHEQVLECGGSCIHTPGHTPGSSSFYFADAKLLIAGDTLFLGSVGRTDFPGGDPRAIKASIQTRLYSLDEAATVVTGHGPETRIGHEMRHNAFVRA